MWYRNHILKARQLGFSTFMAMDFLDEMLFEPYTSCGLVDYRIEDARKKVLMIRLAYENLDNGDLHPFTWRFGKIVKAAVKMEFAKETIKFSNGSSIYASSTMRGGTLQRLHISELGKTAFKRPLDAQEIIDGAGNSVDAGKIITIESTHEGGRTGLHYKMLTQAMRNTSSTMTELDYKFHFFPWHTMPDYSINRPDIKLDEDTIEYFRKLKEEMGIVLPHGKMLWYERQRNGQPTPYSMLKEFPSTPGEVFTAVVEGAIYGNIMFRLRADGAIREVPVDPFAPIFTAWDIGSGDKTAIWLIQPVGEQFRWLRWYAKNRQDPAHYVEIVRTWEAKIGRRVAANFLPHDANNDLKTNTTYANHLREAGLENIIVVPRTSNIWASIQNVRRILPVSVFDKSCDIEEYDDLGNPITSGVGHLDAYHTKPMSVSGEVSNEIAHDDSSHTADAARTFADAWQLGLVKSASYLGHHKIINRRTR
ncbi:MAG: hypothetical protein RR506_09635 [Akkermansia sp.]